MDDKKSIKVFNIASTNLVQYLLGKKSKYGNYIAYFAMFATIFTINIANAQTTLQEISECGNIHINLNQNGTWVVVKYEGMNSNGYNYFTVIDNGEIAVVASKLMYASSVFNLIDEGSIFPCFNVALKPVRNIKNLQRYCIGFYEGKRIFIDVIYGSVTYTLE